MVKSLKEQILSKLNPLFEEQSSLLALWLGGSRATGREDELSDIDFVFVVENIGRAFSEVEACIQSHYEILNIWINSSQRFYILKDTPETFYLDVVLLKMNEDISEYYNTDRHGEPQVVFDKVDILKRASGAPRKETPTFDRENEYAKFEIIFRTFLKEIKRGKFTDAFAFYLKLINTFVSALRFRYAPQRHDFSLRYLTIDLPVDKAEMVERLLKVNSLEEMRKKAFELRSIFDELWEE